MWTIFTSAIIGTVLYVALILIHEEWEERYMMGIANSPPAINLNQPWLLVALIVGVWALLAAVTRWVNQSGQSQPAVR